MKVLETLLHGVGISRSRAGLGDSRRHKLVVYVDGGRFEIEADESLSLLENLLRNGITVDNLCGGRGLCGKCAVKIRSGVFSPPTESERRWGKILGSDMRLSCQVRVLSDAEIELRGVARSSEAKILAWGIKEAVKLDPYVTVRRVRLDPPSLSDQRGDLERLLEAAGTSRYDPLILPDLSDNLRKTDFDVYLIMHDDELIDVLPASEKPRVLGVAVDIGTTTVVAYLYDLLSGESLGVESLYNAQIKFGEDVISRVEYARKNRENRDALKTAVIETINELIHKLAEKIESDESEIYDVVCAGNTTMTSFLIGNDCYHGSRAPYPPPFTSSIKVKSRDLGLRINPRGYVRTVPSISAYVGGDIVADILASGLHECECTAALVDLGTNGEIVIKTGDGRFLAASCAAGPALEGYGVRSGMRAVKGAIESITIDEEGRSYYRVIGGGRPRGICGSGIIEAIAWMRIRGIVDASGRIVEGSCDRVVRDDGGLRFVIVPADESESGEEIAITQGDVRKIQLAKAAIYAALVTLTKIAEIRLDELEKVFIAGAFGTYLDIFAAQVLGVLPDIPEERFSLVGNGSVMGASMILLSREMDAEAREIAGNVKAIELNVIKEFQEEFIKATHIPHSDEKAFENVVEKIKSLRRL